MTSRPTAEQLKAIRKRLRLTQEEIASMIGISRIRWSRYEYGHSRIPEELAAKVLEIDAGGTYFGGGELRPTSLLFGTMATIPVVGRVAAGSGETNVDSDNLPILVPQSLANLGGIGFVIDGESMMPALQPGDVAVFKANHTPRPGFTFLVKTPGDEYRCKNLEWKNNEWTLVSINRSFPEEKLGSSQILGILVGWYRSIGSYEKLEADPHGLRLDVL